MNRLRLHVIACPVFQQELEHLAPKAAPLVTVTYLKMALHEGTAAGLHAALQEAVDAATAGVCDVVAIAYGVCNRGIIGLRARTVPVVIPRAHDCIGILLGDSRKYLAQLGAHPGTYFQSTGWLENSPANGGLRQPDFTFGPATNATREKFVKKYGEENADYLLEELKKFNRHYRRLAYIDTPVPQSAHWGQVAQKLAQERGWEFERVTGDLGWLSRLLNIEWTNREFLKLNPGERVVLRNDEILIGVAKHEP